MDFFKWQEAKQMAVTPRMEDKFGPIVPDAAEDEHDKKEHSRFEVGVAERLGIEAYGRAAERDAEDPYVAYRKAVNEFLSGAVARQISEIETECVRGEYARGEKTGAFDEYEVWNKEA